MEEENSYGFFEKISDAVPLSMLNQTRAKPQEKPA